MAAVCPVAELLADVAALFQLVQRPLYRGAGKVQIISNRPDPWPAAATFARTVMQVQVNYLSIDVVKREFEISYKISAVAMQAVTAPVYCILLMIFFAHIPLHQG